MHLLGELFRRRMNHPPLPPSAFHFLERLWRDGTVHSRKEWAVEGEEGSRLCRTPLPRKKNFKDHLPLGWISSREGRATHDPSMA